MKKVIALLAISILVFTTLAACGGSGSGSGSGSNSASVGMSGVTFATNSVTIAKGGTIVFSTDASSNSAHNLVVGQNGQSSPENGAPDFGTGGQTVTPGKTWTTPPWNTAGTYYVTCTYHPTTMTLTVTVTG